MFDSCGGCRYWNIYNSYEYHLLDNIVHYNMPVITGLYNRQKRFLMMIAEREFESYELDFVLLRTANIDMEIYKVEMRKKE